MKNDRFFNGILVGIAAITVIAIAVYFLRQDRSQYLPEDTPAGVVNNFVLALYQQDYQKAYTYLAELENKPDIQQFRQSFLSYGAEISNVSSQVGETSINVDSATVYLIIIRQAGGLFSEPYRDSQPAQLLLQAGKWKISNMPYPYWDYSWYQPPLDATGKPIQ